MWNIEVKGSNLGFNIIQKINCGFETKFTSRKFIVTASQLP